MKVAGDCQCPIGDGVLRVAGSKCHDARGILADLGAHLPERAVGAPWDALGVYPQM
jgi:hypothetical protein